MSNATNTLDGARIRSIIFDPNTPDYAFLTKEEAAAAFGVEVRTMSESWEAKGFPSGDPIQGRDPVYFVGKIRDYLRKKYKIARAS